MGLACNANSGESLASVKDQITKIAGSSRFTMRQANHSTGKTARFQSWRSRTDLVVKAPQGSDRMAKKNLPIMLIQVKDIAPRGTQPVQLDKSVQIPASLVDENSLAESTSLPETHSQAKLRPQ